MTVKGVNLSPVQRTIRELKNRGLMCDIVERFLAYAGPHGQRSDLFGFIDIIACAPHRGIVGIQCCGSDFAAHYRKITEDCGELAIEWMNCGGKIELWSWRKVKYARGSKAYRWKPRIKPISYNDFKGTYNEQQMVS